jgi:hypothetical protein
MNFSLSIPIPVSMRTGSPALMTKAYLERASKLPATQNLILHVLVYKVINPSEKPWGFFAPAE